jgi:hypothetical protein
MRRRGPRTFLGGMRVDRSQGFCRSNQSAEETHDPVDSCSLCSGHRDICAGHVARAASSTGRHGNASPCRATANTRERCWRPPPPRPPQRPQVRGVGSRARLHSVAPRLRLLTETPPNRGAGRSRAGLGCFRVDAVHLKNRLGNVETDRRDRLHDWLLRIVGALTAPTSMALMCRWGSRPQHQKRTSLLCQPQLSLRQA